MNEAQHTPVLPANRFPAGVYRALLPWCIALVGVLASVVACWLVRHDEQGRIEGEFHRRASSVAYLFEASLRSQDESLHAMLSLFRYSESVTRSEFESAAGRLLARNPSLQGLRWIPRLPGSARSQFVEDARSQGLEGYEITEPGPDGPALAGARDEYFPVLYEVCRAGTPRLAGMDVRTLPAWPELKVAASTALPREVVRIHPVVGDGGAASVYLIESPLFQGDADTSAGQLQGELRGYMVGTFSPKDLVEGSIHPLPSVGLDALLAEYLTTGERQSVHFRPSLMRETRISTTPTLQEMASDLHHRFVAPFGGRIFELWLRPVPEWLRTQKTHADVVVGVSGLLCTLVLTLWLRLVVRRADDVEKLVASRTRELTATQRELREDIRRRVEAEHALKVSEEHYRTFVSQSSDAIWRLELPQAVPVDLPVDEQVDRILNTSHIADCNENTAALYRKTTTGELLGKNLADVAGHSRERHAAALRAFVRGGYRLGEHEAEDATTGGEVRVFRQDLIGVVENNRLARIWITERDLTQQKLLEKEQQAFEQRLRETQRLESLGVLAGGIAHDFNNLLTGILGHASLARTELEPEASLHAHLEQIEKASRSAANLCQQMLAYAGKGRLIVKAHDLSLVVSETANLLQVSVGKHAQLRYSLAPGLPPVMADGTQLQQIVMNLVINAAEAISPRTGHIMLTTGVVHADATTFAGCPFAPENPDIPYVYLEVRDDGCGMSPEVRMRIFEPFFTTKFSGRGLGLAAAIGIVRSHGGALRVESKPGAGSTFTVFLPASTSTMASPGPARVVTNTPWSSEGTLLIIDDEAPVRDVAQRMAQNLGFSALAAQDGAQGVELFRHYGAAIKLVLLDITMPGLSCEQTLAALRAISPAVSVVMMSGYNQPESTGIAGVGERLPFLPKPFTLAQFKTVVRRVTQSQPPTSKSGPHPN